MHIIGLCEGDEGDPNRDDLNCKELPGKSAIKFVSDLIQTSLPFLIERHISAMQQKMT